MLRIASRLNRVCVRTFQSSSRVLAEDAPAGAEATKVTLNFAVPHQAIYESTEVSFWTSIKTNFPLLSTCALPQHCLCGQHKALEKCAKCRCCTTHINKDPRVGHPPFSIFLLIFFNTFFFFLNGPLFCVFNRLILSLFQESRGNTVSPQATHPLFRK